MSLVSVLESPTYTFQYPEGMNIVDTLIVRRLGAYDSDITGPQSMVIGATSNMNIEAANDIRMFLPSSGTMDVFTTSYDQNTRSDIKVLEVSAPSLDTTLITTSNQTLEVRGGDLQSSTTVSHTSFIKGIDGSNQFINLPVNEAFYFGNEVNIDQGLQVSGNAIIGRSLLVNDHLITYGNIFGSNLNLWRSIDSNIPENSNISQVGYGFRVNGNHQLELVKYSKFANKTVAKKVAVFGQAKFTEAMTSEQGIEYNSINDILGQTNLPDMPDASNLTVDLSQPIQTYWTAGAAGIYYNGGNVGIANNNPEFALDVGAEARFVSLSADLTVIRQSTTTSDARLKENITSKSPSDCFDAINSLRVTRYNFKNDENATVFDGLIAQEVEEIFPHAVTQKKYDNLEDCRLIDYNQIIVNLIGAVQHLSDMVADMRAR